jgi:hypothetical protein
MRYEVDYHQSHERLVWWTGGGTHVPEVTGSILAAVIISPISTASVRGFLR